MPAYKLSEAERAYQREHKRKQRQDPAALERMRAASRKSRLKVKTANPEEYARRLAVMKAWRERVGHQGKDPEAHRKRRREYVKHKRQTDPVVALASALRSRTRNALVNQAYVQPRAHSLTAALGCTYVFLRHYIEQRFLPGMTWANRKQWHLDHIKPLSGFNLLDPAEFAKAAHYTNLQPLWGRDNIKKSNK